MSSRQKVTPYKNLDVDETGVVVKATPCKLRYLYAYNASASDRYLKLYDKATAPAETDTPVETYTVPALQGMVINMSETELPLAAGLGIRATTGIADNDTGAPSANDVSINLRTIEHLDYIL